MVTQTEFDLEPRNRGFHLINEEVIRHLPQLPQTGILHLFIKHTSAGLTINENADPDVQSDLGAIFDRLVNPITGTTLKVMTICLLTRKVH